MSLDIYLHKDLSVKCDCGKVHEIEGPTLLMWLFNHGHLPQYSEKLDS